MVFIFFCCFCCCIVMLSSIRLIFVNFNFVYLLISLSGIVLVPLFIWYCGVLLSFLTRLLCFVVFVCQPFSGEFLE